MQNVKHGAFSMKVYRVFVLTYSFLAVTVFVYGGATMKRVYIIVLLCICFCMVSCGKQKETQGYLGEKMPVDDNFVCIYPYSSFLTENMAIYHNQHGRLHVFDAISKTNAVFCFDAGCEHNPARTSFKGEVLQKGCMAYEISSAPVMIRDNVCYFLTDSGEVYSSDNRGENRKLIARVPSYVIQHDMVFFSQNAMYVPYSNPYEIIEEKDDNGNTTWMLGDIQDENTCGIVRVGLFDGSVENVIQKKQYNARISYYDVRGEHVYFSYFYLDIPYVSPELETFGPSATIPEGLTKENYWDFMPKHQWTDVYDYNESTGEMKCILSHCHCDDVTFCKDFFAVTDRNEEGTVLYRYNGEILRRLNLLVSRGFRSDSGLVCISVDEEEVYHLIDENTGDEIKRVAIPYDVFLPWAFIGTSCYGDISGPNGIILGYLSTEDFWTGNTDRVVAFDIYEE